MISCGVPKQAVKHKMILDNLDPNVLDGNTNKNTNEISNTNSNENNEKKEKINNLNSSLGNIFAMKSNEKPKINIINEIKLAKLKKANKKEKILKEVKESNCYRPPSLTQILEMKNKLNKINK